MPQTLLDKIWDAHEVAPSLLYIDRHLVHEVTSPQAFDGLRLAGRRVRRPDLTFATVDHNVPTDNQLDIRDPLSRRQVETLRANCREFGITLYDIQSGRQGIVHVIGPELGLTLPGMTIVCGDSHTSTHGAFGALAFGIGTSEVEHVLATQTLWQGAAAVAWDRGDRAARLGPGAQGHHPRDHPQDRHRGRRPGTSIEYYGPAITALSMEGRMTICNMSIEAGARAGLIAPDDTTFESGDAAAPARRARRPDDGTRSDRRRRGFDREIDVDAARAQPAGDLGHEPGDDRRTSPTRFPTRPPSRTSGRSTTWG